MTDQPTTGDAWQWLNDASTRFDELLLGPPPWWTWVVVLIVLSSWVPLSTGKNNRGKTAFDFLIFGLTAWSLTLLLLEGALEIRRFDEERYGGSELGAQLYTVMASAAGIVFVVGLLLLLVAAAKAALK